MNKENILVIFDYDDTLVDTRQSLTNVFMTMYDSTFEIIKDALLNILPCKLEDIYKFLKNNHLETRPLKEFSHHFFSLEPDKSEAFSWVSDLLEELSTKENDIAICSSNDYLKIHANLERLGLRSYFTTIVSSDSGYEKPDPRLFDLIFRNYTRKDLKSVFIGDTLNDSILAKKAKIPFIHINELNTLSLKYKVELINSRMDED